MSDHDPRLLHLFDEGLKQRKELVAVTAERDALLAEASTLKDALAQARKALVFAQGRIHSDICTRNQCVRECIEADDTLKPRPPEEK